jgi:hypothetical protein
LIKVANKQIELIIGLDVGFLDGIFMAASNKSALPRFLLTGEPLQWAHMLSLTGFVNHVHLSEEAFQEIEKEFSGSGIYDCYPRGVLKTRKTYVMRNASNEDPAQFTHASLDFFLMHALNFREGAEEVIQQLELDVKNLQLRIDLMRGGSHRDAALKLIEQDLLKNKVISPAAALGVFSDPLEQILSAIDIVVSGLPAANEPQKSSSILEDLDRLTVEFEQMLIKAELSSASLRETRKAARQVAATTKLPDSSSLVVTNEAAGVLGAILDDLMESVGDKMRKIVEQEVASNASREIARRFEKIVLPVQAEIDFLGNEIDNLQYVLKGIEDNYTKFKLAMPNLVLNSNKTNTSLARSLGPAPTIAVDSGEVAMLSAQVKQLQTELLNLRADVGYGAGRSRGGETEKLRREVDLVRRELEDSVAYRHKVEQVLEITQAELDETRLSLKLHQQLVRQTTTSSKWKN